MLDGAAMLLDLRVDELEEANTAVQENITELVAKDVEVEENLLALEENLNNLEGFSNSKYSFLRKNMFFSFTKIASFNYLVIQSV